MVIQPKPKLNAPLNSSLIHERPVSVPPSPPRLFIVIPQGHKHRSPARAFPSSCGGNWNSEADMPVEQWRIGGVISDDTASLSANKSKNSPVTSHQSGNGRHFSEWLRLKKLLSDVLSWTGKMTIVLREVFLTSFFRLYITLMTSGHVLLTESHCGWDFSTVTFSCNCFYHLLKH